MNYKSFSDLNRDIIDGISKIPKDVDLVVGIPRSGLLVANIIALILNKPLTDLKGINEKRIIASGKTKNVAQNINFDSIKKILIVEDSVNSGASIKATKELLEASECRAKFIFLAAYVTEEHKDDVDLYFQVVSLPRIFEWNIFHYKNVMISTCFDMDGVLCDDPLPEENDDGARYLEFIKNARPKIIPTCKIGYIVTSRLDKYRKETECWLRENGVEYGELIMLNSTAKERLEKQLHDKFKSSIYKDKKDAYLFIESNSIQAQAISQSTNKAVYCIENNEFYDGGVLYKTTYESVGKIRRKLSRIGWLKSTYHIIKRMVNYICK